MVNFHHQDAEVRERDLDALNVRDLLEDAAREAPNDIFLIHGQDRVTYADFAHQVRAAARAWFDLGIRKGDRVALMLENRPEYLTAWLGLAAVGGIMVGFNTRWQPDEIVHLLTLTEPRFALVSDRYLEVCEAAASRSPGIQSVVTLGAHPHYADFSELCAVAAPEYPAIELRARDIITLISTSGTTGRPKAVMQTHGNYVLTGEGYSSWVELCRGERIYLCLPLFHVNSQAYTVMGAIAARAAVVLVERFSASRFWPDMAEFGVNVFNYIGSMLAVLMKREPSPLERDHHVRLTYGGPALPGPEREQLEERFGITIISGIGMSETTYGLIEPLHERRRSGSLGTPRQHPDPRIVNEARVVDDQRLEVPADDVGELIFRNPVMMAGYFRDTEQTVLTVRDGWLYTGDLVRKDQDGYFYFVDRKKDIVRVRGENVSSAEVEQVLSQHPSVLEAAVVGVPSDLTDEDVAAFVLPRPGAGLDAGELQEWCGSRLAAFKVPRYIWAVDAFPKTETQRIEKPRMRELARELHAREGHGDSQVPPRQ